MACRIPRIITNYRRHFIAGGSYFFTVNLAERSSALLTENIHALRKAWREVRRELPFKTEAIVVLPDHMHCIWTLPPEDADFSARWRKIKAIFSRQLPKIERRSMSRLDKGERGIWQRRFWGYAAVPNPSCDPRNTCHVGRHPPILWFLATLEMQG